jgi:hypothetical protein
MHGAAVCYICYEAHPAPIRPGCGCRAENGIVHAHCALRFAETHHASRGEAVWSHCPTCGMPFSGEMLTRLATARVASASSRADLTAALCCAVRVSAARVESGHYADAERVSRAILVPLRRVAGNHHFVTLRSEADLAFSLAHTGQRSESNWRFRKVIWKMTHFHGADTVLTLGTRAQLAAALLQERKAPESERTARDVLARTRRVLGARHASTLACMSVLAASLAHQSKFAEADLLYRKILDAEERCAVSASATVRCLLAMRARRWAVQCKAERHAQRELASREEIQRRSAVRQRQLACRAARRDSRDSRDSPADSAHRRRVACILMRRTRPIGRAPQGASRLRVF